jgi:hypothetical protein
MSIRTNAVGSVIAESCDQSDRSTHVLRPAAAWAALLDPALHKIDARRAPGGVDREQ